MKDIRILKIHIFIKGYSNAFWKLHLNFPSGPKLWRSDALMQRMG